MGGIAILSYGYSWIYRELYGQPEVVYQLGFTLAALCTILAATAITGYLMTLGAVLMDKLWPSHL